MTRGLLRSPRGRQSRRHWSGSACPPSAASAPSGPYCAPAAGGRWGLPLPPSVAAGPVGRSSGRGLRRQYADRRKRQIMAAAQAANRPPYFLMVGGSFKLPAGVMERRESGGPHRAKRKAARNPEPLKKPLHYT